MRFKFPFEHVLKFRKENENRARLEYVEVLDKLESERKTLKKMHADWKSSMEEIDQLQQRSSSPLARILYLNDFMSGLKIKIASQRTVIQNFQTITEQKFEVMLGAIKEYEIIDKLKERQFDRFKRVAAKREQKANDEIVVTRYQRKEAI